MRGSRTARAKMLRVVEGSLKRGKSFRGRSQAIADGLAQDVRSGLGAEVQDQLACTDRCIKFERNFGHEVVAHKVGNGDVLLAGAGAESHFEMSNLRFLRLEALLDFAGEFFQELPGVESSFGI